MGLSHRNIRQCRAVTWAGVLAVGGGAGWTFQNIYKDFRAGKFRPLRSAAPYTDIIEQQANNEQGAELRIKPLEHYQVLWNCPINGYLPPPPVEIAKIDQNPEPSRTLQPIKDVLQLKAFTLADAEKRTGIVAIKYKDPAKTAFSMEDFILAVGSPLAYPFDSGPYFGKLLAVTADGPVFQWGDQELPLAFDVAPESGNPSSSDRSGTPLGASLTDSEVANLDKYGGGEFTVEVVKDMYVIGSNDRESFSNDTNSIMREAGIDEERDSKGGKKVVFKGVRPHGRANKTYGVESGDVLVSINGVPVTSKSQGIAWVRDHPGLPKYDVVINRRGQNFTKTILVKQ